MLGPTKPLIEDIPEEEHFALFDEEELPVIEMTDSDGSVHRATIVALFQIHGSDQDYAAVIAHKPAEDGSYPIQFYKAELIENDETETTQIILGDIQNDEEFSLVRERYIEILDQSAEECET